MRQPTPTGLRQALVALVLLAGAACGGSGAATPTAVPTPTFSIPTPGASPTATPLPPPPPTSYRFVYREFGQEQDIIWSALPSDPTQREQLAAIPHRADWGTNASLSPNGKLLAYTAFPDGARDPTYAAEAFLMELKSGKTQRVAQGVDLRFRPLWSADGRLVFLRRFLFDEQQVIILQVQLPEGGEERLPTPAPSPGPEETPAPPPIQVTPVIQADVSDLLTLIPVGFAPDKRSLYFVQLLGPGEGTGTVLASYAPATVEAIATATAAAQATATALPPDAPPPTPIPASFVARLSDQMARDFDLSPDASKLVFLDQGLVEGQFTLRAAVADLKEKSVSPLAAEALSPGDQLRPLWHPDGARVAVGQLPAGGHPGAVALVPLDGSPPSFLPPPDTGFDVPLGWDPDGAYLAVTSFSGDSPVNPGGARLVLVASTGQRLTVAEGADLTAVGWLQGEG